MPRILQAGNGQSNNHIATIALNPTLNTPSVPPGRYKFFVCTATALAGPAGGHIAGFNMGGAGNHFITAFEVWTDEAISDFAWMVVE